VTTRRPRNIVSRTAELSVRAAELLDDGFTDAKVAKRLTDEFCGDGGLIALRDEGIAKIQERAVMAFRQRDYERIAKERKDRQEDAAETRLLLTGAKDAGMDFAAIGLGDFARTIKQVLKLKREAIERGDAVDLGELAGLGRSMAAVAKELKAIGKRELVDEVDKVVETKKLTGAEVAAEVKRIMGLTK
jgi:hypothetical protein